jgi:hypothetical protein
MGLIGGLKNRLLGRREELGDIRSHVLGEEPFEREYPGTRPEEDEGFGPREVPELPEASPRGFGERYGERFGREPIAMEEREPIAMEREPQSSGSYELMDRLKMIEAQLSAIRSQTETINERLKNLEMKLTGRRY